MKLYGTPASQASRCMWTLAELDLDYELIDVHPYRTTTDPDFLALNPNGKIPVLIDTGRDDGDVVLWESIAINTYLAQTYGERADPSLWPGQTQAQAHALQWSVWVVSSVEPYLAEMWRWRNRDPYRRNTAQVQLTEALQLLDTQLQKAPWMLGDTFSVADINVESYVIRARRGGYDLSQHEALADWIRRCEERPARQAVRAMIRKAEASSYRTPLPSDDTGPLPDDLAI